MNKAILYKSALVSFLYVGFGTISILGMYPQSPIYWELSYLGFLVTLPVSVLGFGIIYMESENYSLVLSVQAGMFFLFWFLVYLILIRRHNKRKVN